MASLAVIAAACSSSDTDSSPSAESPTAGEETESEADALTVSLNPNNLLSATVETSTPEEVSLTVVATDSEGHRVEMPAGPVGTDHLLPLLGLRPDRTYTIEVLAAGEAIIYFEEAMQSCD